MILVHILKKNWIYHFAVMEEEMHDYGVSVEHINVDFNGTSILELRFFMTTLQDHS